MFSRLSDWLELKTGESLLATNFDSRQWESLENLIMSPHLSARKSMPGKTTTDGGDWEFIIVTAINQTPYELQFRIKHKSKMRKLKNLFSTTVGIPVTALRFMYAGRRIGDEDTPELLEIKNGDVIHVYSEERVSKSTSGRKTGDGEDCEFIMVKAISQNSHELHFRIKDKSKMSKLKNLYSVKVGIPVTALRFMYNGRRVGDEDTPKLLEMKNGDVIEVDQKQKVCNI